VIETQVKVVHLDAGSLLDYWVAMVAGYASDKQADITMLAAINFIKAVI
jgi:hypothetical protein